MGLELGNALRRLGRDDITLRSLISNAAQKIYESKFSQKLSIHSVIIRGKNISIHCQSPLIASQLRMIETDIEKSAQASAVRLGLILPEKIRWSFR